MEKLRLRPRGRGQYPGDNCVDDLVRIVRMSSNAATLVTTLLTTMNHENKTNEIVEIIIKYLIRPLYWPYWGSIE